MRSLDWALCRSFLAVLRDRSLSGAARTLGVAHPTIRRHLDELEAVMGAPLFVRSPTGLVPTDLALELREPAETMEAAAARMVRTASSEAGAIAGAVRITASEVMGAEVLPPILAALKQRHPALCFELSLSNDIENLLRRDADIAVRMTRPTQDDLVARKIGVIPVGLYAHESWIARHGEPASLETLGTKHCLIGYDRDTAILRALAAMGLSTAPSDYAFRSDNDLAQLAALRAGLGIGFCQIPLAARDARLRRVLPGFVIEMETWLVTHPNLRGVHRVRATMDALATGLAGHIRAG